MLWSVLVVYATILSIKFVSKVINGSNFSCSKSYEFLKMFLFWFLFIDAEYSNVNVD